MTIDELREQYPQYNDLADNDFADKFHQKFYSDMPKEEFYAKIGVQKKPSLNSNPVQQDEGFLQSTSDDMSKYGITDEIVNAATLGLGPRVRAAGGTAADVAGDLFSGKGMPDISDSYDRNVSQQFQERDAWRKENPNLAIGASIGGAFANPLSKPIDAWMRGGKFLGVSSQRISLSVLGVTPSCIWVSRVELSSR